MCNNFSYNYLINFGPQHPAAHGVLRLLLEMDGEQIRSVDPHIGFLHRGTEKLIESKPFTQSLPYFDRLDYVSMLSQEHSFVLALESLLNIDVPIRAQYIRILFNELTRLLNHLMCLTTHALDVGALTPFLWGFEEREHLLSFYEEVSGARMHAAYFRVGGVCSDLPDFFLADLDNFLCRFWSFIDILEDLLHNPIWVSRLCGVGLINVKSALDLGLSGPVLRGSGISWDLRKLQPYDQYDTLSFDIPVGFDGDCYSRYHVRVHEMKESLTILMQCIEVLSLLRTEPYIIDNSDFSYNSLSSNNFFKSKSKISMEELIFHFKNFSNGMFVPEGEVYVSVEAPKGETGVFIKSLGSNKPYRCKLRAPGFFHLQSLDFISKDHLLADVVTNIGSLDIVFGEIDR